MADAHRVARAPGAAAPARGQCGCQICDGRIHLGKQELRPALDSGRSSRCSGCAVTSCHSGPSNCAGGPHRPRVGTLQRRRASCSTPRPGSCDRGRRAPGDSRPIRLLARASHPRSRRRNSCALRLAGRAASSSTRQQQLRASAPGTRARSSQLDAQHVRGRGAAAASARRSSRICPARAPRSYSEPRLARSSADQLRCCAHRSATRALAVHSRPDGGSTIRGCSAGSVVQRAALHARARAAVPAGMRPKMVQPMWPPRSPTTTFWCGMPICGASASASATESHLLELHEVQVGRRRQLRQPRAEPAHVLTRIRAQQHALRTGTHQQLPRWPRRARGSARARPQWHIAARACASAPRPPPCTPAR